MRGGAVLRPGYRLTAAAVVALVTIVTLGAAGRPGRLDGAGQWLIVTAAIAAAILLGWAATVLVRRHPGERAARARGPVDRGGLLAALAIVVVGGGLAWLLVALLPDGRQPALPSAPKAVTRGLPPADVPPHVGHAPLTGSLLLALLGVLVLAVATFLAVPHLRRHRQPDPVELVPADPLAAAIEAALIDLEGETDPRRAVIKAYARTEAVLRAHGLPRDPAETPVDYLDRVLRELGARATAVDRLTALFERAAFSRHDVRAETRDEAVAAFHLLRADLATSNEAAS